MALVQGETHHGGTLRAVNVEKWRLGSFRSFFQAPGCLWPFVFARAGVFGGFFLFEPPCVGASNSKRGPPLGSRKTDAQSEIVLVLRNVLGKHRSFIVLVSTTPSEESAPVTFFSPLQFPPPPPKKTKKKPPTKHAHTHYQGGFIFRKVT